ncbi:MAG: galactokinase [Clostridiales bacterium]|jgi:galactokinase|nr:galactokinase [Clostridiales bacterium]
MNRMAKFKEIYGDSDVAAQSYFSPGRVNLIGEHIDYSGGNVLPCAIDMGTYAVVRARHDMNVRMMSLNFEKTGILTFDLRQPILPMPEMDWGNYPMGIFKTLMDEGAVFSHGFDMLFEGDLPNGAGLSSSASIEVLTAVILNDAFALNMSRERLAVLCQRSENVFNGVNCGIMDQFIVAVAKADHAVRLDCDTLQYDQIPSALGDYRIVIINTNKKRGLVDSEYNARRRECEAALTILKQEMPEPPAALCALTPKTFLPYAMKLSPTIYRRASHAITENYRTEMACQALENGDLTAFGEWMYRSHDSLQYYYEVSCRELDIIVDFCREQPYVLGARMTGGGFGGCAIALVHEQHTAAFEAALKPLYAAATGLNADIYIAKMSSGARRLV